MFLLFGCGGGGGNNVTGVETVPIVLPPNDTSIEVDFQDIESVWQFLEDAKQIWSESEGNSLADVVSRLSGLGYNHKTIINSILDWNEFKFVNYHSGASPEHSFNSGYLHPFALWNIHVALAAGLTGRGQLIAIRDTGFNLEHTEFEGKNMACANAEGLGCAGQTYEDYGWHGTLVSGIEAAVAGNGGMMGVAPEVDLLICEVEFCDEMQSVLKARDTGAVALNNSWGYGWFDPGQFTLGPAFRSAYDSFQEYGVVVWARGNQSEYGPETITRNLPADWPAEYPELADAWLVAINATFYRSPENTISRVDRESSACTVSAAWCLVGSGLSVLPFEDQSYAAGAHGTSFVAPQLSGAVALLAEAFPDLTPADWTARLLASANNEWFTEPDTPTSYGDEESVGGSVYVHDYIHDGSRLRQRCWNNGTVCHTYSLEWGHGLVDMEADLSPIGGLSLLSGLTVQSAHRLKLDEAILDATPFMEHGLQEALDMSIAVLDGLNTNFEISAADLLAFTGDTETRHALLDRFRSNSPSQKFAFSVGNLSYSGQTVSTHAGLPSNLHMQLGDFGSGRGSGIVTQFGFGSAGQNRNFGGMKQLSAGNPIGFVSVMADTAHVAMGHGVSDSDNTMFYGFAGDGILDDA